MSHRENNIDSVRLVLALLVLLSHSWALATGTEAYEPLFRFSGGQHSFGSLAVDCFFILSGLLIAQSWDRSSDLRVFAMKRVRRIYPGFLAASAICLLIVAIAAPGFGTGVAVGSVVRAILLHPPPTSDVFADNPFPGAVNGSLWTIWYEALCYALVAVLGACSLLKRRGFVLALFAAALLVRVVFAVTGFTPRTRLLWNIGLPEVIARLLPLFLVGVLAYLYRAELRFSRGYAVAAFAVYFVSLLVPFGPAFTTPTALAYFLLWLCYTSDFSVRVSPRVGDLSYGVYLYAFPVQQLIVAWFDPRNAWILFAIATPSSLLAGYLSYHLVEKRFLGRKRVAALESAPAPTPQVAEAAA